MQAFPDILPVGTIVHSMLTEAQFQAETSSGWILADGRSVTGSRYAAITGATNAPDTQGRFLRARDAAGTTDPDGTVALGTQKTHRMEEHSHYMFVNASASAGLGNTNAPFVTRATTADSDYSIASNSNSLPTDPATIGVTSNAADLNGGGGFANTGTDTRPLNIIVNVFIRIN